MPISFPASPTSNQTYTYGSRTYRWTGTAWEFVSGGGGSGEDTALRAYFLPPAPTSVSATGGNAQAVVSWTAPTVLSQTPITDYVVQYSTNSGSTWTTFTRSASTATTATVTGLTNGTAYVFRVAGVNGVGAGAYSAASGAVTPVSGDPFWSSVQLLLPGDTSVADASSYSRSVTASGGAAVSTAQKKWGAGSIAFDGFGDYLTVPDSAGLELGSSDFVIEMWLRTTQTTAYATLVSRGASGFAAGSWSLMMNAAGSGSLSVYAADFSASSPMLSTSGVTVNDGEWHHVAWTRSGTTHSIYVDGVRYATATTALSIVDISAPLAIGNDLMFSGRDFSGNIDDLRLTVGNARYTGATITVPTAAFPNE